MTGLTALWLPILLSGVFVFIASSLIHMVLPWHKGDYPSLPNEDAFRAAVGALKLPPGEYMVPRAGSMAEMGSPEFKAKMEQGPVVMVTVRPNGMPGMGRQLGLWFVFSLVVSVFAAYVTGRALGQSSPYLSVFRFAGVTAFIGYSLALWSEAIWYFRGTRRTVLATFDGLIYALITAGTFGWLWPQW
ncbi:MAG: hypothetical protein FJ363_04005 [Gemmatimonadetes bacterium]|nr:hypothetical protein [Gemmatimonadota bacterium]